MERAALYIRVSTEEQALHGLSIDAQTTALEEWAKANRVKVVGVYTDAGISARKPASKRPALQQLLQDVKAGKMDLIVFTKLDRWFRNIAEYYKVQEILDAHNVSWKAAHDDYEMDTASGRMKINIMLTVAQDEADRTSERIKAVFASKKERREPCTGKVPTGYKIEGKKVVKDPEMEGPVSCFFESFLACHSTEKARRAVQERYGVLFTYYLCRLMLGKEAYYGRFEGIDGMCPAYITKEQFEEIAANRRRAERKSTADRVYLFTGLLYCPVCGRRFGSRTYQSTAHPGGSLDGIYYNCRGKYNNGDCTNSVNIRERAIEACLLENVDEEMRRFVVEVGRMGAAEEEQRDFQAERAKLRKKLTRLKDLYVNDIIDLELYRKDYEVLNARLEALAAEESKARRKAPSVDRLLSIFTESWQDTYRGLDRSQKQAFWRTTMDKIYIHPTRQITFSFRL